MSSAASLPNLVRVDSVFALISGALYSYVSRHPVLRVSCCTSRSFKNALKEDLIRLATRQL